MHCAIIGAGAWGTAMAMHLCRLPYVVTLVTQRLEQTFHSFRSTALPFSTLYTKMAFYYHGTFSPPPDLGLNGVHNRRYGLIPGMLKLGNIPD